MGVFKRCRKACGSAAAALVALVTPGPASGTPTITLAEYERLKKLDRERNRKFLVEWNTTYRIKDPLPPHEIFPGDLCVCTTAGGPRACFLLRKKFELEICPIGASLPVSFFAGSPQQHALLNRHLADYYRTRNRSQETTPYNIPNSQLHLLPALGMEKPEPDAPERPHALHKCIEEGQLRRIGRTFLSPGTFGIVSVKTSKLALLPAAGSVQNPVFQARDVTRYPGSAVKHATLANHPVHLMHDVSSEVTPHELVEKLVSENPEGHLLVTGVNPVEVLDGCQSFEPSSHSIEYDLDSFNFIFTDSESESYFTPSSVTRSWLRTSSVCGSNGRVYHVTLLEYKLGHCVWHIYCGDAEDQHTRTFPTHSYVRVPSPVSGTLSDVYLPARLLTGVLDFCARTPDLSTRNLAAKVTQLANGMTPKTTARERWVATHVAQQLAPVKTWGYLVKKAVWASLYAVTLQWHMLKPAPDIFDFVDERKRVRTVHPTPGGGWTQRSSWKYTKASIPNNPRPLERLSAVTASCFTFLVPKILAGELLSNVLVKLDWVGWGRWLYHLADASVERLALTTAIVAVTSILPGSVVKVVSRLAGHFWRQVWLPGWCRYVFDIVITETTGGPGHVLFPGLPGRGWFWQLYLWLLGTYVLLPGLPLAWTVPWLAIGACPGWWLLPLLVAAVGIEQWLARLHPAPVSPSPLSLRELYRLWQEQDPGRRIGLPRLTLVLAQEAVYQSRRHLNRLKNAAIPFVSYRGNLGNCARTGTMPALPVSAPSAVRRRNVDVPLPGVVLIPDQIPGAPVGVALAVEPNGVNYPDWLQQVQAAYAAQPNAYPQLTPGQACFWDAVSAFGGTPHMWYSWFMAYTKRTPVQGDQVVGNVTLPEMQEFAVVSRFGLSISGLTQQVMQAQGADRPTLHLRLSRSELNGQLHVDICDVPQLQAPVNNLARLLATIQRLNPAAYNVFLNAFNLAPPDATCTPLPTILAMAGEHELPTTTTGIADAITAAAGAREVQPAPRNEGFTFNHFANPLGIIGPFYEYDLPLATMPVGHESSAAAWTRYYWHNLRKGVQRATHSRFFQKPVTLSWGRLSDQKVGATRTQARSNRMRNNERPEVPVWTTLRNELAKELEPYRNVALPAVPLAAEYLTYTVDVERAARLVSDLRAHPHTIAPFGSPEVIRSLDAIVDLHRLEGKTVQVPLVAYLGCTGSGKTTATASYLRALTPEVRAQARILTHTESLRAQAKSSLDFPEFRGYNFPTVASLIAEPSAGPIVFDDAGKYWGGLLDLVVLANPGVTEVVVNGDPTQTYSKFPEPGTQSRNDLSPIAAVAQLTTRYATVSHRAFQLLANTLGIHTTSKETGFITHCVSGKKGIPVVTGSPRYATALSGYGRHAETFGSVQGEDFQEPVEVDITALEGAFQDAAAVVGLTRSKTGVYLQMEAASPTVWIKKPPTSSDILNALVYAIRSTNTSSLTGPDWLVKAAYYRHMAVCMPRLVWFASVGASIPASLFQNVTPACTTTFVHDTHAVDAEATEQNLPSTGAFENLPLETHFVAKEFREVSVRGQQTNQFAEVKFVNPPVHHRGDTSTYFYSVEKRLKTATRDANVRRKASCPRRDMCDEYDRLVPTPPLWSAEKHEHYVDLAIEEYCSKRTAKTVLSKLAAWDPDRSGADIKISLKGQVSKKSEKRNKLEAIPGQLIHEYDISQTLTDAAYALFLENEIIPAFPPNFLFYRRMAPEQFVAEYKSRWKVGRGNYSSDVTRWDVGCDAGLLNFDEHVMRRSHFPAEYITEYVERRLTSRSQHGPMATMQNSGDRYTWPLNTVRRAVVTSIVCQLGPDDTVTVNGDDAAVDRFCHALPFPDSPWEFKDVNGETVEFSGFQLGGPEPLYDAEGLWYRTAILLTRDPSAQDKWVNYLDLLRFADRDDHRAVEVAAHASRHLNKELFQTYLPAPFRPLFPSFFEGN